MRECDRNYDSDEIYGGIMLNITPLMARYSMRKLVSYKLESEWRHVRRNNDALKRLTEAGICLMMK